MATRPSAQGTPLLRTKPYIPAPRPAQVLRPRLVERLDAGLHCKVTLISAPAGFDKTTLLSEQIHSRGGVIPPAGGERTLPLPDDHAPLPDDRVVQAARHWVGRRKQSACTVKAFTILPPTRVPQE
jgi:hypothetical protein